MAGPPFEVYFAFPDSLLRFNCPECGFTCCKGFGFAATSKEGDRLAKFYPTLKFFAQPAPRRAATGQSFVNLKPNCFFLQPSGLCDIHATHGRETKPVVCKTFPANSYFFSNEVLVVDVNTLCPLKVTASRENDVVLRHSELLEDIVDASEYVKSMGAPAMRSSGPTSAARELTKEIIASEIWSRDCFRRIETEDLFEVLANWDLHGPGAEPRPTIDEKKVELELFRLRVATFLGAEQWLTTRNTENDLNIIALSASIRMSLLRRAGHMKYETDFLPSISRVFCAIAALAQIGSATQKAPLSLQGISGLVTSFLPAFFLLGHLDHIPVVSEQREGEKMTVHASPGYESCVRKIFHFIYSENDEQRLTLGEIIERHARDENLISLSLLKALSFDFIQYLRFLGPKEGAV